MKTASYNGYNFNYKNTDEIKYLERVEKDGSIAYYRLLDKVEHSGREYLPTFGRQEFIDLWDHLPRTCEKGC